MCSKFSQGFSFHYCSSRSGALSITAVSITALSITAVSMTDFLRKQTAAILQLNEFLCRFFGSRSGEEQ
jgi:hypothetical protein